MNKKLKKKWIKALNSGDFEQGRLYLHHAETNKFCCLGVLCDLVVDEISTVLTYHSDDNSYRWGGFVDMTNRLNSVVLGYTGLTDREQHKLINLNDHRRKSFKKIAKYIKKNI
jgi:hypothetical protein